MSFSAETKNELTRIDSDIQAVNLAELAGIVRLSGSIQIAGFKKMNLKIITELNSIARKVFKLLKHDFNINTTIAVNKNQMLKRNNSYVLTELNSIARKVFKLLKHDFNINTTIAVNKNQMLKRNNSYVLTVKSDMGAEKLLKELGVLEKGEGFFPKNDIAEELIATDEQKRAFIRGAFLGGGSAEKLLKELGVLEKGEGFFPKNDIAEELIATDEQKRAFIRGAFLGGGSISDPEKNYHLEFVTNNLEFAQSLYHLEFVTNNLEFAQSLRDLINSFDFNSKIVARKNNYVVYIKESEQISDLLSLIGAHNALLKLQNVKIVKEMRNNVNRIVNCETANLTKAVNAAVLLKLQNVKIVKEMRNNVNRIVNCETANLTKAVNAAVKQVENIRIIEETIGIKKLPENLQQIALLRVENEELTLKELGEMLTPPVGKSGVNYRLKRIQEIADNLREKYNIE